MSEVGIASLYTASITVFVALIFARAAWHKLGEFTEFTGFVADYRLLPERLVRPASMAIVGGELLVVLAQLVPGGQVYGLLMAIVMLALYAFGMAINITRGRTFIECGCGGAVQPLSWTLVIRNSVLILLTASAVATAPFSLDAASGLAAVATGFTFWVGFVLAEQILANSSTARLTR